MAVMVVIQTTMVTLVMMLMMIHGGSHIVRGAQSGGPADNSPPMTIRMIIVVAVAVADAVD
eukprot:2542422-Pyramimonas_sp.AAC.1